MSQPHSQSYQKQLRYPLSKDRSSLDLIFSKFETLSSVNQLIRKLDFTINLSGDTAKQRSEPWKADQSPVPPVDTVIMPDCEPPSPDTEHHRIRVKTCSDDLPPRGSRKGAVASKGESCEKKGENSKDEEENRKGNKENGKHKEVK